MAKVNGGKNRKHGREKKKRLRSGPLSQYVKGKISFETYWKTVAK